MKRLNYLLEQTEIFSHFVQDGQLNQENSDERPRKRQRSALLQLDRQQTTEQQDPPPMRFEQTPWCKCLCQEREGGSHSSPSLDIQGGEMRDYQVRGLNWLISLDAHGINGILADEMVRRRTRIIVILSVPSGFG